MAVADIKRELRFSAADRAIFPSDLWNYLSPALEAWADIYNALKYSKRVILKGPPGTGKSTAGSEYGRDHVGLERFTITPETCAGELFGRMSMNITNGTMEWKPSYCARSWLNGDRAVVDEIDKAGGDTIPFLHMWLDDSRMAVMTTPDGQTIRPKESFSVVATTNEEYEAIPEALLDRFVVRRHVGKPNPHLLMSLPRVLAIPAGYVLYAPNPPKEIAKLTTRSWVEMGRLINTHGLSVREAFEIILGDKNAKDAALAVDAANAKAAAEQAAKQVAELA